MSIAQDDARAVADVVAALRVDRDGDSVTGVMPTNMWGPVVFGGFAIAHAIVAAGDPPEGRRLHSIHAYFLRPVQGGTPIAYDVQSLREGRTLSSRRLDASQNGKRALTMNCSYAADGDTYEYQPPMPSDVPEPDEVADVEVWGPWRSAVIGPTEPEPDGTYRSTHRMWFRTAAPLGDDPTLHAALIGFATDMTWKGTRPLHLDGDTRGIVSLDHAVWFHRPLRADEWTYYDVHSIVNTAGRGLVRGAMYDRAGRLCVSVAQETLLTRYEDAAPLPRAD